MPPLAAPDYFAGSLDPIRGAYALFTEAGWIRRRCNEILAEPELDPVKLYGLAGNCATLRLEAAKWIKAGEVTEVLAELARLTRAAGVGFATKSDAEINGDYKQLLAEAAIFEQWCAANLPGVGQQVANATVTVNRTWPNTDFVVRAPKAPAITTRVQALRDVFL